MPLQTTEAADLFLDRMWATTPGALVEVGLLNGDPDLGGVELNTTDCPGYARYSVTAAGYGSFWLPSSGGLKSSNLFNYADATGPWDDAAEWEGIWVDGVLWDAAPLVEAVAPSEAGPFAPVQITRRF